MITGIGGGAGMGWADCGTDREGRRIGYAIQATCDHEGCDEEIDRGLAYACGGMHGEADEYCGKYVCGEHKLTVPLPDDEWTAFDKMFRYGMDGYCQECVDRLKSDDYRQMIRSEAVNRGIAPPDYKWDAEVEEGAA